MTVSDLSATGFPEWERIDTGPLSWVASEIHDALEQAARDLERFSQNPEDATPLRMARSRLHQAHGALQMVEMEGVSLITEEIEHLFENFEHTPFSCDQKAVSIVTTAFRAINGYIEELLAGAPHQPLRLFPVYRGLMQLRRAERIHPADLFFPDLSIRPPGTGTQRELSPAEISAERVRFERGLLRFLRNDQDREAAAEMGAAVTAIEVVVRGGVRQGQQRAFWWVTRAFFDALAAGAVPADLNVKRLCARINLQIRRLLDGSAPVAERLLRDTLFFVARAGTVSDHIAEVKRVYQLENSLPDDFETERYARVDTAAVKRAKELFTGAKTAWTKVVGGDIDEIAAFARDSSALLEAIGALGRPGLAQVAKVIADVGTELSFAPRSPGEGVGLDVATALLFMESALEQVRRLDDAFDERAMAVVARVQASALGLPAPEGDLPWLNEITREAQERVTMATFIGEMQGNLRSVEKSLDAFFRDSTVRAELPGADRMLAQISGALAVLGHEEASKAIESGRSAIRHFTEDGYQPNQTEFERVANTLGAVGFYIERMQHRSDIGQTFRFNPVTGDFSAQVGNVRETGHGAEDESDPDPEPEPPTGGPREASLETTVAERGILASELAATLRAHPENIAAREQLAETLQRVQQDAVLIDDSRLRDQAASALKILNRLGNEDSVDGSAGQHEQIASLSEHVAQLATQANRIARSDSNVSERAPAPLPAVSAPVVAKPVIAAPIVSAPVAAPVTPPVVSVPVAVAPPVVTAPVVTPAAAIVPPVVAPPPMSLEPAPPRTEAAPVTPPAVPVVAVPVAAPAVIVAPIAPPAPPPVAVPTLVVVAPAQPVHVEPEPEDDSAAIDAELLEIFLEEAKEVLVTSRDAYVGLMDRPGSREHLVTCRRAFHTLKGSGRMVGLDAFGAAAWSIEQTLNDWMSDNRPAGPHLLALIDCAIELLQEWVTELDARGTSRRRPDALVAAADEVRAGRPFSYRETAVQEAPVAITPSAAPVIELVATVPEALEPEPVVVPAVVAVPVVEVPVITPPIATLLVTTVEVVAEVAPAAVPVIEANIPAPSAFKLVEETSAPAAPQTPHIETQPDQGEDIHSGIAVAAPEQPEEVHAAIAEPVAQAPDEPVVAQEVIEMVLPVESGQDLSSDTLDFEFGPESFEVPVVQAEPVHEQESSALPPAHDTAPAAKVEAPAAEDIAEPPAVPKLDVIEEIIPVKSNLLPSDFDSFWPRIPAAETRPQATSTAPVVDLSAVAPAEPPAVVEIPFVAAMPPAVEAHQSVAETDAGIAIAPLPAEVSASIDVDALAPITQAEPAQSRESVDAEIAAALAMAGFEQVAVTPETVVPPAPPVAVTSLPIAAAPTNVLPFGARSGPASDEIKQIGHLSLSVPLYNIYLNEADELLRVLTRDFGEWRHELHRNVSEEAVRAAHSLSGSSSTVGLVSVHDLAYAVEIALQRLIRYPVPIFGDELAVLDHAVVHLRSMLQQFSAASLPEPSPQHIAAVVALRERFTQRFQAGGAASASSIQNVQPASFVTPQVAAVVEKTVEKPVEKIIERPPERPAITTGPQGEAARSKARSQIRDEIDPELIGIFIQEAQDYLPQIGENLRFWQRDPQAVAIPQALLRQLHTVKGSARMAGAMRLGDLIHEMETRVESGVTLRDIPPELFDELLSEHDRSLELFEALVYPKAAGQVEVPFAENVELEENAHAEAGHFAPEVADAVTPVGNTVEVAVPVAQPGTAAAFAARGAPTLTTAPVIQVVRVRADVLDRLVNQAGEVSIARARLENEIGQIKTSLTDLTENVLRLRNQLREVEIQAESQMQSRLTLARETEQFDPLEFDRFTRFQELTRMMAESVNDVATIQQNLFRSLDAAGRDLSSQQRMTRDLQQDLMRVRMVPFSSVSDRLYRVVRQTAKELGKRVNLDIRGAAVELDRSVLERMAGPFEHLLRNAIVHGIETRDARRMIGKDETGELLVEVRQEGNEIVLTFSDDGAGLNFTRIRDRARSAGLIGLTEDLPDARAADLIFQPGFTTATEVTELAGRGVGMDVVRSEAGGLGGRVAVDSISGRGSRFTINLPLTLAVTQAVLVKVGERVFALPSVLVEQVQQLRPQPLAQAYNEGQVIWLGQPVKLHFLAGLLGESDRSPIAQRYSPILILRSGGERIAIHVDSVIGNQEVVVKNIGPQLARMQGIAGATVLGSGDIVLILNPVQLAQQSLRERTLTIAHVDQPTTGAVAELLPGAATDAGKGPGEPRSEPVSGLETLPTVMVVDDSLTVRRVTQRLLAREGYQVVLAKDGVDALQQLQDYMPDVMLVDIEMPRMDGFDLTRNVRGDERYKRIPIVMITSRTADKHRTFAMNLGVDVYLGKPYNESELLAHIARFVGDRKRVSA